MSAMRLGKLDAMRAVIAGSRAVAMRAAARVLFETAGHRVLPPTVQRAVKNVVEREASRVLAAVGVTERALEGRTAATSAVAAMGARQAGRQLARNVGAAAGAGALVDGGWALFQVVGRVRRGAMTRRQAAAYVAREAGTGAAATAAGTAAASLLVAMTGGVAAPAVFVVAAAASLGAKAGLDAWLRRPQEAEGSYARLGPSHRSA